MIGMLWFHFHNFSGYFDHEIVSVSVPGRKGTTTLITKDENPRPETTKDTLSKLRPAFIKVIISYRPSQYFIL